MSDDDLAPLLDELATTLNELRDQLEDDRPRQLRGLLRFTEQYTIPAVISLLETNIRLLELTAGAIRLADGRLDGRERGPRREVAVDALERALDDLGGALRGDPTDPEARQLLEEARDLRREVRGRLTTATEGAESTESAGESGRRTGTDGYDVPVRAEGEAPDASGEEEPDSGVDVDAELETIRREVHGDEDEHSGEN